MTISRDRRQRHDTVSSCAAVISWCTHLCQTVRVRHCRAFLAILATLPMSAGLALVTAVTPASADPTPAASATGASAKPGQRICEVREPALKEASGLAVTENGYAAVADGGESLRVYLLDGKCKVTSYIRTGRNPFDPEDLAVGADGTLWVGDIGDNKPERDSVALFKIRRGEQRADLYRMRYPDGVHDAEALLVPPQGNPVIVTKQVGGAALYTPATELDAERTVDLRKVGQITLTATGTSGGPLGSVGQTLITGGAVSPDGRKVVLRSYTDAYEWDVTGNDIGAAITKGKPRRTPLPDEPQGEAITYTRDGKAYVTVSEAREENGRPQLLRYQPLAAAPTPGSPGQNAGSEPGLFDTILDKLGLSGIMWIVIGIGLIGLVLVLVGGAAIRSSRRRGREEEALGRGRTSSRRQPSDRWHADDPPGDDSDTDVIPRVTTRHGNDVADPYDSRYERASRRRDASYDHGSYDDRDPYDQHNSYRERERGLRRSDFRRDREPDGPRWRG